VKTNDYVLNDLDDIPIAGWLGPAGEMIRPDVMRDMAAAGFNVSISSVEEDDLVRALGVASEAGVRLIIRTKGLDLGRKTLEEGCGYQLTQEERERIRRIVLKVHKHPGLFGYYVHDEPWQYDFDWIAAVIREIEAVDPYHMCYVNHNAPVDQGGYGAGTQEALWRDFAKRTNARCLSFDHYVIERKPRDFIEALGPDAPNVFGDVVVKFDYFAVLDFARWMSVLLDLPLWAFTNSVPHWSYPPPTEGHIRFQLMCLLAYGAKGLQYFTYAHDQALIDTNGAPTPTWTMARKVNAEVRRLWKKLKTLRSIGVFHTGPLWPGTRPPMPTPMQIWGAEHAGTLFTCKGDPAVIGLFDDTEGQMYALVVNRNPSAPGVVSMREPEINDAVPWQWTTLPPGGACLFKLEGYGKAERVL